MKNHFIRSLLWGLGAAISLAIGFFALPFPQIPQTFQPIEPIASMLSLAAFIVVTVVFIKKESGPLKDSIDPNAKLQGVKSELLFIVVALSPFGLGSVFVTIVVLYNLFKHGENGGEVILCIAPIALAYCLLVIVALGKILGRRLRTENQETNTKSNEDPTKQG